LVQPAGPVTGIINGVPSQTIVQIERARHTFRGKLSCSGPPRGSSHSSSTGERIDRVHIGAIPGGFMIRAESSAPYTFRRS